jgi:hypothetical protein
MNNWQRVERAVKWAGLSVNSFALSIGLARGENLYQIKRGNNGISRDLARMIAAKYPQISQGWLLTGEGNMLVDEPVNSDKQTSIPFYGVDVEKYIADPSRYSVESYFSLPFVDDAEFAAVYLGRAMGDAIPAGAIVVMRRVAPGGMIPGGDYVVVCDDFIVLRRVRRKVGTQTLRLTPVDEEKFDEVTIDANQVREMYLVRSVVVNKTF